MPARRPRPAAPRRADPAAWAWIFLLTALSVATADGQSGRLRSWRYGFNQSHAPYLDARTRPKPGPTPWPSWVSDANVPVRRVAEGAAVGLLVFGTGLASLATRRARSAPAMGGRHDRAGPGRVAAAISTGGMALGTLVACRMAAIDPRPPIPAGEFWRVQPGTPAVFWPHVLGSTAWLVPETIAAAWIYLAAAGGGRRRPADPVERLGRWLGWAWIGIGSARRLAGVLGMTEQASS